MTRVLSTQVMILRRIDYGEADKIITFLSRDAGKIRAIAKGVRRQKSKMAGGLELFSVSEVNYIKGKGEIDTLTSTRLIRYYGNIIKQYDRTQAAYSMLGVINRVVEDHHGSDYFPILVESIAGLDNLSIEKDISTLSFYMRLLRISGSIPDFTTDEFGEKVNSASRFMYDFESMKFKPSDKGVYDKNHIKVLRLLSLNSPGVLATVGGIEGYCEQVRGIVESLSRLLD